MKRKVLTAVAIAALGTLGMTGTALASTNVAGTVRGSHVPLVHSGSSRITPGSVWTYYDLSQGSAADCEVLSFQSGGAFTGDLGDVGSYKATSTRATIVYKNGVFFRPATFTGKWTTGSANFTGTIKEKARGHITFGPEAVYAGNDPLGAGTC